MMGTRKLARTLLIQKVDFVNDTQFRDGILDELKQIIFDELNQENVRIYLFGSWARHEEKHSSDIDIAIEPTNEIPLSKWTNLVDRVEESTIPYKVDIVNLNNASKELIKNVKKEGILWKDFKND